MAASRRSIFGLVLLVLAVSAASQWWAQRSRDTLGAQLVVLAQPGDIQLLSSTTCAYCTVARQWLTQQKVPFSECFIETDRDCAARFEAVRAPGTPVVLVRDRPQLGFDAQRVLDALAAPRS